MKSRVLDTNESQMRAAIRELKQLVRARFPDANFGVTIGEDPFGVYLTVYLDIDDSDKVMDIMIDKLLEIQVDRQLSIYPMIAPSRRKVRQTHAAVRVDTSTNGVAGHVAAPDAPRPMPRSAS
ncbi:MAG: hypothetical protein ACYDCQ_04875 [Dehalococcoidia bacterium]